MLPRSFPPPPNADVYGMDVPSVGVVAVEDVEIVGG